MFRQTVLIALGLTVSAAALGRTAQDAAKEIANPLTDMTLIPIQANVESDVGPLEGDAISYAVQPLTSFSLTDNLNVISRTIIPYFDQEDVTGQGATESGLGDITQSFFFSPVLEDEKAWSWGVGPAFSLATGDDDFTINHNAAGITGVAVKVSDAWTYGSLVTYMASVNDSGDDPKVEFAYFQPFLDYTTESAVTYELTTEATYDIENEAWSFPLILTANKIFPVSNFLMAVGGGPRYWLDSGKGDPEGWGLNLTVYFFLPN